MGNSCSSFQPAVKCVIDFDQDNDVSALGNIQFGQLQPNPDIAGIGTVLAIVLSSGVALLISLILMASLIIARIPRFMVYLEEHPSGVIRRIIPSPTELIDLPPLDWNWHLPTFSWNFHSAQPTVEAPSERYADENQFEAHEPHNPQNRGMNPQIYGPPYNPPPIQEYPQNDYNQQNIRSTSAPSSNIDNNYDKRDPSLRVDYQYGGEEDNDGVRHDKTIILRKISFPEQVYECLEAALFSVPDSQVLLAIALAGTFLAEGRCSLTQYHVDVAVNLILLACINYGLAFIFVRNYWETRAAFLRIPLFSIVLGFLGWLFHLQQSAGLSPERLPPSSRVNSMILLDAECFLNTTSASALGNLTTQEYDTVGFPDYRVASYTTPENICFVLVVVMSGINMVIRLTHRKGLSRVPDDRKEGGPTLTSWLFFVWWGLTWVASSGLYITSTWYIVNLRQWVAQSGWIQLDQDGRNPENRLQDFGQLSAIVATAGVLVAGADRIKTYREKVEKE